MDANGYLAELQRILADYNAQIDAATQGDGKLDGAAELGEAKQAQNDAQRQLRALKQQVTQAEKEIRASATAASRAAGAKQHGAITLLAGRGAAGRARADNKRAIAAQKDQLLAPYQQVKLKIDDALRQIAASKERISAELSKSKTASTKSRSSKSAKATLTEQLAELAALHKAGGLTDEEFSTAKAKLLG